MNRHLTLGFTLMVFLVVAVLFDNPHSSPLELGAPPDEGAPAVAVEQGDSAWSDPSDVQEQDADTDMDFNPDADAGAIVPESEQDEPVARANTEQRVGALVPAPRRGTVTNLERIE